MRSTSDLVLMETSLNNVQIFQTGCRVENKHFIGGFDKSIFNQTAQRCHAGRAFRAEKNSFGFFHPGNLCEHLIVADAQCRSVDPTDPRVTSQIEKLLSAR